MFRSLSLKTVALGAALFLLPALEADAFRVVIDAGHGGRDGGAKWGGVTEKYLTLDVAKRVQRLLRRKGVSTTLTRTNNSRYVSLGSRAYIANKRRGSVFVSIHFNAARNRSARGIETYYCSSKGKRLAYRVQKRLMSRVRTKNRGIKNKSFTVLRKTNSPAILVECGFLSNSWERKRCSNPYIRQVIANSIVEGIMDYRRSRYYAKR